MLVLNCGCTGVAPSWCWTATALVLYWCCTGTVLVVLCWYYTGTGATMALCWYCVGATLLMHRHYSGTTLVMSRPCAPMAALERGKSPPLPTFGPLPGDPTLTWNSPESCPAGASQDHAFLARLLAAPAAGAGRLAAPDDAALKRAMFSALAFSCTTTGFG